MRGRRFALALALLVAAAPALADRRLEAIRARGYLTCGIRPDTPGFASRSTDGRVSGFEPDLCRAVAAAILGASGAVRFVPARSLRAFVRFGAPDLVARRLTVTLRRDVDRHIRFSPIVFYDGLALLVPKSSGIAAPRELAGRRICVHGPSEAETGLASYLAEHALAVRTIEAPDLTAASQGLLRGDCDALAADESELAPLRAGLATPAAFDLLSEFLAEEPLALLLHADDRQFVDVVRWTVYALIMAEELGITQAGVRAAAPIAAPRARRLLGLEPGNGAALGIDERWAANAIASVGNYGEIFARNLGSASPLLLPRGRNALWREGGLLYAPPLR